MADGSPKTASYPPEGADFVALYGAHAPMVRSALRQLGVGPSNLDDAVQDVFVVLHRRLGDYDRERSIRNWLWGIARGVASGYRRGERRRQRLHGAVAAAPSRPSSTTAAGQVARGQASAILGDFLASLDADKCAVFVLAEIEGRTGAEIARTLGVNINTVYARLRAARQRFQRAVQAHHVPTTRPLFAAWLPWLGGGAMAKPAVVVGASVAAVWLTVQTAPTHAPAVGQAQARVQTISTDEADPTRGVSRTSTRVAMTTRRPMASVEPEAVPPLEAEIERAAIEPTVPALRRRHARVRATVPPAVVTRDATEHSPATMVAEPLATPPPRAPWQSRIDAMPRVRHPQMLSVRDDFVDELLLTLRWL